MLLSPVPREDQEDVTEIEEASPLPVCSQPTGFPRWVSSIQSLASLASAPLPTGSLDRTTAVGPLRSVWILRRSSWTPATSPPLLRRTCSSTSPYHRHSRRWPAAWLSTVCQCHRYRLVLWGPRAHPSWKSRNSSIRSCGRSKLSRRKQLQLPRPVPLMTSCWSL